MDAEREHLEVMCPDDVNAFTEELMVLSPGCFINFVNDVRRQFINLWKTFYRIGFPPEKQYSCIGDYVDQDQQPVVIATLLFAHKLKCLHNIYLFWTFMKVSKCASLRALKRRVFDNFMFAFNHTPIAAVVE